MLSKAEILAARAPQVRVVNVAELGGEVGIKAMTAGERDAFEVAHTKSKDKDFRARLAAATVCDAVGQLLFGPGDIPALSALPASVLEPIVQAAVEVNQLSSQAIEDLKGNS